MGVNISKKTFSNHPTLLGMLVFGSIWGTLESTVGGAIRLGLGPFFKGHLHMCPCPLMMFAFGFPVMAAALAIYKKPAMLLGIGVIAALFSFLVIPLQSVPAFTTPLTTYPIINPVVAIISSSIIFSTMASLVGKRLPMNILTLAGIGAISAMLGSIVFIYVAVGLGSPILTAIALDGQLAYIATNGVLFALISAATLPIGYHIGSRTNLTLSRWVVRMPWIHRVGPIAVLIFCWSASVAAIAAGVYVFG